MNQNEILKNRFLHFSKYCRYVALISFVIFIIVNAINTGDPNLGLICYILITTSIIAAMQSIVLYVLASYFSKKK